MWKNTSMSYIVQIVHIKALPLGFLVSYWMILFETVMTCPVRDPGFQNQCSLVSKEITPSSLTCITSYLSCLGSRTFCLLSLSLSHDHFQFPWVHTSLPVPDYFWRSLWWLCKLRRRRNRGPFLIPSFVQFKLHVCGEMYLSICDTPCSVTTCTALALPTGEESYSTMLGPPLASIVLHCLWSEIVT